MNRRDFLKTTGIALIANGVGHSFLFSSNKLENKKSLEYILYDEYPWPYPNEVMDSAERIWFEDNEAWLNVFVKPGKALDIRLYVANIKEGLYRRPPIENLVSIKDSFDIPIGPIYSPKLHYKIEYREGKGSWKSLAPRAVKTPNANLKNEDKVKIVLIGDDHIYADLRHEPEDKKWRKAFLRGDYVSEMMKEIILNPFYMPDFLKKQITDGFTHAWTLKYILETKPDFVIDLGDTIGPDSYRIWGSGGQWINELQPEDNLIDQSRILWERKRRVEASVFPEVPFYLASGNHDGENGWMPHQSYTRDQRKRLLRLPRLKQNSIVSITDDRKFWLYPEFNGNHYAIKWAGGDIQFIILDPFSYTMKKPEKISDWTLGREQKRILENYLRNNNESPWKFICCHNTLGGSPWGSGAHPGAYGRGPLFTREDYEKINEIDSSMNINPDEVEQVWLTELAKDLNIRGFFYGHDHVFFLKNKMEKTRDNKEMIGVCVGSTKYSGSGLPNNTWASPYWIEFYGHYLNNPPSFYTPPGITEMEIDRNKAVIRYVCVAPTFCMCSNIPSWMKPGDVVMEYEIFN